MDRSSMLNSYVSDNEANAKSLDAATDDLNALEFRIKGSKSVSEIKREVEIFLEKNEVSSEVKDNLLRICDNFSENTTVYQAISYLEDFMNSHVEEKENDFEKSNDTVNDIKEEVISDAVKSLDDVGVTLVGDTSDMIEKIRDESDVYKLRNNIDRTTEHLGNQNEISSDDNNQIEIDSNIIEEAINTPGDQTILESVTVEQERAEETDPELATDTTDNYGIEVLPDGTIVYHGNTTIDEDMNFMAMVAGTLVVDNKLNMNFSKTADESAAYRVAFGNFSPKQNNNQEPIVLGEVTSLVNNYNPMASYKDVLMQKSPELMTSLNIIDDEVLGKKGLFQMNVNNNDGNLDFSFILDDNYNDLTEAFTESGAMVTNDAAENSVVVLRNTTPGDNLFALNITAESIHDLRQQVKKSLENGYQKKLEYKNSNNETALANPNFLVVVLIANLVTLVLGTIVMLIG